MNSCSMAQQVAILNRDSTEKEAMAPADVVPELMDGEPKDAKVEVPSTWRSTLPHTTTSSINTDDRPLVEVQTQTAERFGVGVQTDDGSAQASSKAVKQAAAHLPGFLSRVEGLIEAEFVRVAEEHEALEPLARTGDQGQEPATLLHSLTPFTSSAFSSNPSEDRVPMSLGGGLPKANAPSGLSTSPHAKLVVTCLSWSSTGQTIAASYGRYDVEGWCTDRGALVTWNIGREQVLAHKPDTTIDVDVCLMSCAFHPEHPALVAGGTFNGDVYVWDLSQEGDMQRGRSDPLCDIRHQEPICGIAWQYSMTEANKYGNRSQAYRLVTLGADGRVLVWTWHKMDAPVYAYQLLWPAPGSDRKILWGGTAMSFMSNQMGQNREGTGAGTSSGHFVVGTEGGRLFKCYYDVSSATAKEFHKALLAGEKVEVRCPIKEASYTPHAGAVYGVHCCPHQRDLFLSAGADGSVRMYHSLRGAPLMVVEPSATQLMGVQWSATRPLVFAAAGADGQVYMYDLLQTQQLLRPCLVLDASPMPGHPAHSIAFNAKRPDLFATGGQNCIMIWRLPSNLSTVRKGEITLLRKVAASDDIQEALRSSN